MKPVRRLGASRTSGIPRRVPTDKKQTDRERRSNNHDINPRVRLSRCRAGSRKIDIFRALQSFRCQFEGPGDDERDRKSDRDQQR